MRKTRHPTRPAGEFCGRLPGSESNTIAAPPRRRIPWPGLLLLVCGLANLLAGCKEALPPYEAPADVIRVTGVQATIGTDSFTNPDGRIRSYIIFLVDGESNYDDTLQDTAHVSGLLEVWLKSDPGQKAVLPLTNGNITPPTDYRRGILTIDPEEEFHLQADWTMFTDAGSDILRTLAHTDTTEGTNIAYTVPDTLVFRTELTLFAQVEPVESDTGEYGFVGYIQLEGN